MVSYLFTGCGTKKVEPNENIKQEIIKAERDRLNTQKKEKQNINISKIERQYGYKAKLRAIKLNKLINSLKNASENQKITKINNFYNLFKFTTDLKLWGIKDFWATRMDFIGKGAGDCEDFVIAKYFTLSQLGIPTKKLYITYVKSLSLAQAHMVLTYYKTPNSIPLVLDNIKNDILLATQRKDLTPIYSFNEDTIRISRPTGLGKKVPSGNIKNKKWIDLMYRMGKEGDYDFTSQKH